MANGVMREVTEARKKHMRTDIINRLVHLAIEAAGNGHKIRHDITCGIDDMIEACKMSKRNERKIKAFNEVRAYLNDYDDDEKIEVRDLKELFFLVENGKKIRGKRYNGE